MNGAQEIITTLNIGYCDNCCTPYIIDSIDKFCKICNFELPRSPVIETITDSGRYAFQIVKELGL